MDGIRKIDEKGIISTITGTGIRGFYGDGGNATNALLYYPSGVALDNSGNIYLSDSRNKRVRKVDAKGIISTISYLDNFNDIVNISTDNIGNLFVVDELGNSITKLFPANGRMQKIISGDKNYPAFFGDAGDPLNAKLNQPGAVLFDQESGDLYISDSGNDRIRVITSKQFPDKSLGQTGS